MLRFRVRIAFREEPQMRIAIVSLAALGLALAACGNTDEKRAATGGLAGAGTGLLVGGPIGAAVGAAVGGVGGAALDEGAEKKAERVVDDIKNDDSASRRDMTAGSGASSPSSAKTADVRRAQEALKARGLYTAEVDGRMGPKTKQALREFQRREGLPQTATLDSRTMERLAGATSTRTGSATGAASTTASGAGSTGSGAYAGGTATGGGTAGGMGGAASDGSASGTAGAGAASR
jgi:hypothetical protein